METIRLYVPRFRQAFGKVPPRRCRCRLVVRCLRHPPFGIQISFPLPTLPINIKKLNNKTVILPLFKKKIIFYFFSFKLTLYILTPTIHFFHTKFNLFSYFSQIQSSIYHFSQHIHHEFKHIVIIIIRIRRFRRRI